MDFSRSDGPWEMFQPIDLADTSANQPSPLSSDARAFGDHSRHPQRCPACGAPAPPYPAAGTPLFTRPEPHLGHSSLAPEDWGWLPFQNPGLSLTGHVSTPIGVLGQTLPEQPVLEPSPHINSSHAAQIQGAFDFGDGLLSTTPGDLGSLLVPPAPEAAHFKEPSVPPIGSSPPARTPPEDVVEWVAEPQTTVSLPTK